MLKAMPWLVHYYWLNNNQMQGYLTRLKGLQKQSGRSLYQQIAQSLMQSIEQGELKAGDPILPQRELAQFLEVSRVTVRKAIELLIEQQLIDQKQGVGTYVAAKKRWLIEKSFASLSSFTEDVLKQGEEPNSKLINQSIDLPSLVEQQKLQINAETKILRLERVRFAGKQPLAFETSVIPFDCLKGELAEGESLYLRLSQNDCAPITATQHLNACNAPEKIAQFLDIKTGDALLFIERQSFSKQKIAVEYTSSYYRGDIYDFVAQLQLS